MPSFADRLQDLIARNVESVIEAATNPARMLTSLQREIEEAIISLEGDRSRARQRRARLEGRITQNELREADWAHKAQSAMAHGREDLARQALMAREGCTAEVIKARQDLTLVHRELADIEKAMMELEARRTDVIERARAQAEVDAANAEIEGDPAATNKADALRSKIAKLQKRAEFSAEQFAKTRSQPSASEEIEEVQNKRRIDIEIEAMKRARGEAESSGD